MSLIDLILKNDQRVNKIFKVPSSADRMLCNVGLTINRILAECHIILY